MAAQPVRQRLAAGRLGEGVVRSTQHRHEDLRRPELAGAGVDHRHGLAGIVDKQLLAGPVVLAHRALQCLAPGPVSGAELRVAVAAVREPGRVFLPDQLLGHAWAFELEMNGRPVRGLEPTRVLGMRGRIKQPRQRRLVELCRQRPGQPQLLGPGQQLLDRPDADLGAPESDGSTAQRTQAQAQHILDFSHCISPCSHEPSEKVRRVAIFKENNALRVILAT